MKLLSGAAVLSLAGCGTLLGGGRPAQLFALDPQAGGPLVAERRPRPTATRVFLTVAFAAPVEGDRMMAVKGARAYYLKGVRWIAPFSDLFDRGLREAIGGSSSDVYVLGRSMRAKATAMLDVDVRRFEVNYGASSGPPDVVIEASATLRDLRTGSTVRMVDVREVQSASSNRADALADAFRAVAWRCDDRIVEWMHDAAIGLRRPSG